VVRAGVGPDYTPTPTASKMVIKDVDAMTVYILSGGDYFLPGTVGEPNALGVYATRALAEAAEDALGPAYEWYSIDEMEVAE